MKKKKVLIIEDDEDLVEMYKEKLRLEGFRVATVTDSRRALNRLKEGADLVLLDILMPGLNGFEILKRIKKDKEINNIPVIVLTNIGSDSIDNDKKLAMSLGATDYMIKSLNTPDTIVKNIHTILARE